MLSARSLITALMCGAAALAFPMPALYRRTDTVMMSSNENSNLISGAAFFITNEPDGNFVVAAAISNDGNLVLDRAVSTRGLGAHGISDPTGPDPLFSQGSVKVSETGEVLAVVNAGSNTVSLFIIDPRNPVDIVQIGQPVSSEGEFPISVAFNQHGTQACVLNGGAVNGINCFNVDKRLGLVPIPNTLRLLGLDQTTPPRGPAGTASQIVFSEDNTRIIVSVKGSSSQPGFLAVWDIASDGTISKDFTKIAPASGGLLPFSMTVIPGKDAILATDAGIGFDVFDFSSAQNGSVVVESSKNSANKIEGQSATCWSAFSQKTGNFYLTDIGTSIVTEVNVDDNLKGTIVKQYQQRSGSATIDIDIININNNDFLFILESDATAVTVLVLDGPGQARSLNSFDIAGPAKASGLTINAVNLQGMTTFVTKQ